MAKGRALCQRADALLAAWRPKEALALYEQALKLLPQSKWAQEGAEAARKLLAETGQAAAAVAPAGGAAAGAAAGTAPAAVGETAPAPPRVLSLEGGSSASRAISLAVLPFRDLTATAANAWVGPAVAETLSGKLADVPGVHLVERGRLQEVLQAGGLGGEPDAGRLADAGRLLGADALLLGSVQSSGAWNQPGVTVRLDARVVRTENGKVAGETAVTVNGPFQDLFRLQRELAARALRALGTATSEEEERALARDEAQNLEALRAFGEARRLLGTKDFRGALALMQEAQRKNGGEFFAAAHRAEGDAYTGLVESAKPGEKDALKKEHLEKFRRDAEEAAPAFFDLGVACEASGVYTEAIQAYESFLKHAGQSARTVRWRRKLDEGVVGEPCVARDALVFSMGQGRGFMGVDARTGDVLWRRPLNAATVRGIPVTGSSRFAARYEAMVGNANVTRYHVLDGRSGLPVWGSNRAGQGAKDEEPPVAAGDLCFWVDDNWVVTAVDALSGRVVWRRAPDLPSHGLYLHSKGLFGQGESLYFVARWADGYHVVFGLQRLSGRRLWYAAVPKQTRPVAFGSRLALFTPVGGDGTVDLEVRAGATGTVLWRQRGRYQAPMAGSERILAVWGEQGIVVLDAASGKMLVTLPAQARSQWFELGDLAWVPAYRQDVNRDVSGGILHCEGRYLFFHDRGHSGPGDLVIVDAVGGRVLRRLPGVRRLLPCGKDGYATWMADGTLTWHNPLGAQGRLQDMDAFVGIARAQAALGRYGDASATLSQATQIRSDLPGVWQWLALASERANREADALDAWLESRLLVPGGTGPADLAHQHLHDLAGIAWICSHLGPLDRVCGVADVLCCLKLGDFLRYDNATALVAGVSVSTGTPMWHARVPRSWQYAGKPVSVCDFAASAAGMYAVAMARTGWSHESTLADADYVFPINPHTGSVEDPIRPDDPRLAGARLMRVPWNALDGAAKPVSGALDDPGQPWVISGKGEVVATHRASRRVCWRLPRVGEGTPERVWSPGGPYVYIEDDSGTLCAVDLRQAGARAASGHRWWRETAPGTR